MGLLEHHLGKKIRASGPSSKSGLTHFENGHFQSGFMVNFQSGYTHFWIRGKHEGNGLQDLTVLPRKSR